MGKIIELRPADPPAPPGVRPDARPLSDAQSITQATQRLVECVGELVRTLEASHHRIRVLIDGIPDPEAAARLSRDHASLSAALRDAKAKALAIGLIKPGD